MWAQCYFCGTKLWRDDYICARCGQCVCEKCDVDTAPDGPHDVFAHKQKPRPGKWDVKRILLVVLVLLMGCKKPEEEIEKLGGKAPVLCLRKDNDSQMYFCRDFEKKIWVCTGDRMPNCVAIDRARTTLDGVLPEKAPTP